MHAVQGVLCDRIISRGLWPPRSRHLTKPDFNLWGKLKSSVHGNNPETTADLRRNTLGGIRNVQPNERVLVFSDM